MDEAFDVGILSRRNGRCSLVQNDQKWAKKKGIKEKKQKKIKKKILSFYEDFILEKKERKKFIDYNPLFAIEKNSAAPQKQILSFDAYYRLKGTTKEQDGWKMVKPQKAGDPPVYYVREN